MGEVRSGTQIHDATWESGLKEATERIKNSFLRGWHMGRRNLKTDQMSQRDLSARRGQKGEKYREERNLVVWFYGGFKRKRVGGR